MELVSVIVPVYNVEKYLARCIQSVCGQSYQGLEIILVDDGSKDKSGVICDEYAERDGRIKVIHKQNGGLGDARNAGVEMAEGKYLLFVDSDDRIHENLVRDTVETAEKNQADMVIFDYIGEEENGNLTDRFTFPFSASRVIDVAEEKELIMRSCSAVNKLIRRDLWKESGFQFPKGRYYEDLATIPKVMTKTKKIVYLPEVYYYYLMRDGSIMHSRNFEKNYEDRTWAVDQLLEYFERENLIETYRNELEYLVFENTYFVPSKEIVLNDRKSEYLKKFRDYAYNKFPQMNKNYYVQQIAGKDKILLKLLQHRMYGMMVLMSQLRRMKDRLAAVSRR